MSRPSQAPATTRPSARPTPLSDLLEQAQTEAARRSGAAITPNAWRAAVGPRIAARTSVGRLVRGRLTIYASSAAWANELTFLSDEIVARLRTMGLDVNGIRFQIKDLGFAAGSSTGKAPPAAASPPKAELPASLRERLEKVDDPALRAAIAEAAALSLGAKASSSK